MIKFFKTNFYYLFVIIPLFFIPFLQSQKVLDTSIHIRFIAVNICLLIICLFLIFKRVKNKLISINVFFYFYIFYVLFSVVSFFISIDFAGAIYQLSMIINFGVIVFLFFVLFQLYSFEIKNLAIFFCILTSAILIATIYQYFNTISSEGITHQSIYNIKASFSHKNILSEVLFFLFPFSVYLLFMESKIYKIWGCINSLVILFFIIVLITRAVWLALLISPIISIVLFFFISSKSIIYSFIRNKKTYYFIIGFILIISVSIFAYSKLDSFETIKKSTQKIFSAYDSSQHRIELWKRSIDMAKESPLFGKGLGSWRIEVLKYGNRNLQSEDNITFYQRPHNDFLWILSEQGFIGFIMYLIILGIVFYYLIKILRQIDNVKKMVFFYLMFYLLVGYLVFSFFSFPRERIEHNLFLGIVFAFIISFYEKIKPAASKKFINNKLIFLVIFLILIFNSNLAFERFGSESHLKEAFVARSQANWSRVIHEIEKAESPYYHLDPFSTPINWYSGEACFNSGDVNKAKSEYEKSLKLNPYHIHVLNNLASCMEIKGYHQEAINIYKRAIEISPKFDDALLNLTAVYFNKGLNDSALLVISKIDTLCKNEKYFPFLEAVLKKHIGIRIKSVDNKDIVQLLNEILLNKEWILNIFKKSRLNNINFDKQLFTDCVYVLKEINHSIDEKVAIELKIKYIEN